MGVEMMILESSHYIMEESLKFFKFSHFHVLLILQVYIYLWNLQK